MSDFDFELDDLVEESNNIDGESYDTPFLINITMAGGKSIKKPLEDKASIGNSEEADITITNAGLSSIHGIFRVFNNIISFHNTGKNKKSIIGKHTLQHGRMYIIDLQDEISMGSLAVQVARNEDIPAAQDMEIEQEQAQEAPPPKKKQVAPQEKEKVKEQPQVEESEIELQKPITTKKPEKTKTDNKVKIQPTKKATKAKPVLTKKGTKIKKVALQPSGSKLSLAPNGPNALIRIYAFIVNVFVVYGIVAIVLPTISLDTLIESISTDLAKTIDTSLNVKTLLPIDLYNTLFMTDYFVIGLKSYLVYIVFDLICHLLLGTTFTLFLCGVTSNAPFSSDRIKALIRWLISTISAPLILFDLPLVASKKSLKEILSSSDLICRNSTLKILVLALLYPLIIISVLFAPLGLNKELFSDCKDLFKQHVLSEEVKSKQLTEFVFNFKIEPDKLAPSISLRPEGYHKSNNLIKKVRFLKSDRNIVLNSTLLFTKKKLLLKDIIQTGRSNNPLFAKYFPALNQFSYSKQLTVNPNIQVELQELMQKSLSLNMQNLKKFIMDNGPFVAGFVSLKNMLDEQITLKRPRINAGQTKKKKKFSF